MTPDFTDLRVEVFEYFDSIDRPFLTVRDVAKELDLPDHQAENLLQHMMDNGMYQSRLVGDDVRIFWPNPMPSLNMEARALLAGSEMDEPLSWDDIQYIVDNEPWDK